jgi:hypothetical protein
LFANNYWQCSSHVLDCSRCQQTRHANNNQTKPNQTTMNQYKATTRVPHINEPFVDWYDAETEEQARTMWESDRQAYGLPADAIVKFELERRVA